MELTQDEYTEVFEYLDGLRESGVTNMFGAGAYVEGTFCFNRKEASHLVGAWMETFSDDPVEERAELACKKG